MTPEFSNKVDPIFLDVFNVLHQLDATGEGIKPAALRKSLVEQLNELIEEGESPHLKSYQWEKAVYAITCWIDEMLIAGYEWEGANDWKENPLEWDEKLFGSLEANAKFYREDGEATSEDAVETFYVCALLGFRGLYGADNSVNEQLKDELNLPAQQEQWVEKSRQRIKSSREEREAESIEKRTITVATPQLRWSTALLPWILVPILFGAAVVFDRLTWW